jgi:diguanylate cyclase (GGDEF)-like protein
MTLRLDETQAFPVLLVEDNRGDARLVEELLRDAENGKFAVSHVERLADARQRLMETGAGCVLLDLSLPDASRLEALMQLRAAAPDVPIVILSGLQDELLAVKAVQEGAQDYLVKGRVDGNAIGRSITYAVERKHAEMELSHKAMHDALTGLPNRTLFLDRLKHALMRAKRHHTLMGVMFIDLDGFKPINDTYGHEVGDRLLVALAGRLQEGLRGSDTAARFGGDEFMVLCEDVAGQQDVIGIAQRILRSVTEPFVIGNERLSVEASMGIAITDGKGDTADSLLRNADAAMYGAKQQGVAFEVFGDDIQARVQERVEMERQLRRSVDEEDFRLLFQPQVDLHSGEIVGLEALLRWDHPARGLIEPIEFLWLAEETALATEIGDWVLEQTCRHAALWREAGPSRTPLRICVNLSAPQHFDPTLMETVRRVVNEVGIDPSTLCLEITEGVVMRDAEAAIETLRGLKQVGVTIAMDDFGSSQSSLGALKRFPLDILKVDRSLVSGLGEDAEDAEDAAIVTAVISMAHALGLVTIADGIATREQVELLKEFGCDVGQGHYFARPRPAEAIAELLGATVQGRAA